MASLLFKEMKGLNLSCTSPASTAVCPSIERKPMVRPGCASTLGNDMQHVRDPRRKRAIANPFSQTPTEPKSYKQESSKNLHKASGLISPMGSSRHLLSGGCAGFDEIQEAETAPTGAARTDELQNVSNNPLQQAETTPTGPLRNDQPSVSNSPQEQVVVLRVSLHCKACEGKVRKHISKMAGVTSFSIDFATKKVTVIGDVTPLGVLNSISKVKNAQFWASPPCPSATF